MYGKAPQKIRRQLHACDLIRQTPAVRQRHPTNMDTCNFAICVLYYRRRHASILYAKGVMEKDDIWYSTLNIETVFVPIQSTREVYP